MVNHADAINYFFKHCGEGFDATTYIPAFQDEVRLTLRCRLCGGFTYGCITGHSLVTARATVEALAMIARRAGDEHVCDIGLGPAGRP